MTFALFLCFTVAYANTQDVDEQLWGEWELETVEINTEGKIETYTLNDLLADKSKLTSNMFKFIYIFGNEIEVNINDLPDYAYENEIRLNALKGTFATNNGQLTISLREKQVRIFTYTVENKQLKIRYIQENTQYELIYKPKA